MSSGALPPQPTRGAMEPVYRVFDGSPAVLAKYPRRTKVTLNSEICLKANETITIVGSNGQEVTYTGPGCARRNANPTRDNVGGFTFGWNGLDMVEERLLAP